MDDLISRRRLLRDPYFQEGRYPESHLLRMAINEQPAARRWIPVTERLPKPYVDVITLRRDLLCEKYHAVGLEYITLHGVEEIPTWSKDHLTWKNKVTHWLPLPEPPKEEKENG